MYYYNHKFSTIYVLTRQQAKLWPTRPTESHGCMRMATCMVIRVHVHSILIKGGVLPS